MPTRDTAFALAENALGRADVGHARLTSRGKSERFGNDQSGMMQVSTGEKFIVIPYRKKSGRLVPGEMRQASNPIGAEKIASAMSERFAGVAAYAITVDEETGDMLSPRLLAQFGEIADLNP
jgi:hypothetical protein